MGKYRLKFFNCIQETDSEERRDALLRKGYVLESVDGEPAGTAATLEERFREAEKHAGQADQEIERLKRENEELKKENAELKKKAVRETKAGSGQVKQELKDA